MIQTGGHKQPVLLVVDDDPASLHTICHELEERYGRDYHVVSEDSVAGAERALRTLRETGEEVALVLVDHRWQRLRGRALGPVPPAPPLAKRALLVPWGAWRDRATAAAILRAVDRGKPTPTCSSRGVLRRALPFGRYGIPLRLGASPPRPSGGSSRGRALGAALA